MLFDAKQFEQHFEEPLLRKGLRLFERQAIEPVGKHAGSDWHFIVAKQELRLKKRGDKVMAYQCSCRRKSYCEHLCAALFFLQQPEFAGALRKKLSRKATSPNLRTIPSVRFTDVKALLNAEKRTPKERNRLLQLLFDAPEERCFPLYLALIKALAEPLHVNESPGDTLLVKFNHDLVALAKKITSLRRAYNTEYYLRLALLCELQNIQQLHVNEDNTTLKALAALCYQALEKFFLQGLSGEQKEAWQSAFFASIRNNGALHGGAYVFLLPRLLRWQKNSVIIQQMEAALEKRRYKPVFPQQLNYLNIARLELRLKMVSVSAEKFSAESSSMFVEGLIARAELDFYSGKIARAFKLLKTNCNEVAQQHPAYYGDYTEYALGMAEKFNEREVAAWFMEERILKSYHWREADFERLVKTLDENQKKEKMLMLASAIKKNARIYSFEKLATVLLRTNALDELIALIRQHGNAFGLMQEVALKKLPLHPPGLLSLYADQFTELIKNVSIYSRQLQLFEKARTYIDRLPTEARNILLDKIVTNGGSESQLSKHILRVYAN